MRVIKRSGVDDETDTGTVLVESMLFSFVISENFQRACMACVGLMGYVVASSSYVYSPPLTSSTCPLTYDAHGHASSSIAPAASSTVPARPSGTASGPAARSAALGIPNATRFPFTCGRKCTPSTLVNQTHHDALATLSSSHKPCGNLPVRHRIAPHTKLPPLSSHCLGQPNNSHLCLWC